MEKILNFCKIGGKRVEKYEGKRNYVATGDIVDNKILNYTEVSFDEKPSRANQDVKIGDVLFAKMKDTIKVVNIDSNNVDKIFSTGFFVLTPKDNVKSEYLYWLFNSPKFNTEKNKNCKGATQKAINEQGLNKITINRLPSIAEQNSIISKFNNIKNIIELRKKQIEELNQIIKSQFVEMFGDLSKNDKNWIQKQVIDVCNCMVPGRDKPKSFTGNIPWITIEDLNVNSITYESKNLLGLTESEIKEVRRKKIPKGSVIMSCVGNLGICSIAGTDMAINQQLHSFQCKKEVNNIFLMYMLGEQKNYMYKYASNTTVAYMNKTVCNSIPIFIPPIELQNQFAEFVQVIDKQKFEIEKSLKEMEELYESLMERYFG